MNLSDELTKAAGKVESILRGKTKLPEQEMQKWIEDCYGFYTLVSSKESISKYESLPSAEKVQYLEAAIKLYNKLRNVSPQGFQEIKLLLKGACAWIFSLFAERNGKSLSVLLKTLSKCGSDFLNVHHKVDMAVECFDAVLSFWEAAVEINIFRDLPPLELQFLKICVLNCILYKLDVVFDTGDNKKFKSLLTQGAGITQGLPVRYKLHLAEKLIKFGQRLANDDKNTEQAASYFKQSHDMLNNIGTLKDPSAWAGQEDNKEEKAGLVRDILESKIKVNLYLAFIYARDKNATKALECIAEIENIQRAEDPLIPKGLEHSFLFAKLIVAVAQHEVETSFQYAKALIQHSLTNFETALSVIKSSASLVGKVNYSELDAKYAELYKIMSIKYPSDPEFTLIRMNYLQSALAVVQIDAAHGDKSYDIANRIISEHINGVRTLPADCAEQMRLLFVGHIVWLRERKLNREVNLWCDLFIQYLETYKAEQLQTLTEARLIKVDILMELKDYSNALSTACKALYTIHNIRTVVAVFRALIQYEGIAKGNIVQYFLNHLFQSIAQQSGTSKLCDEDFLYEISVCCGVVEDTKNLHSSHRNLLVEQLLLAWIHLYHSKKMWKALSCNRHSNDMEIEDKHHSSVRCTLYEAVFEYCCYVLRAAGGDRIVSISAGRNSEFDGDSNEVAAEQQRKNPSGSPLSSLTAGTSAPARVENSAKDTVEKETFDLADIQQVLVKNQADLDFTLPLKLLHVVKILQDVLQNIKQNFPAEQLGNVMQQLGKSDHLLYLANLSVLIAQVLVKDKQTSFMRTMQETCPEKLAKSLKALDTAAIFFSIASFLYNHLPDDKKADYMKRYMACLLQSAAAHLDAYQVQLYCINADIILPVHNEKNVCLEGTMEISKSSSVDSIESEQSTRIGMCRLNATVLEDLLNKVAEFADEEDKIMLGHVMILLLSSYCLAGENNECEKFLEKQKGVLMRVNADVLYDCVVIASSSNVSTIDTLRKLITYALQACLSHSRVNYRIVGGFYRRLLELSPSRKYALDKVVEIEQILREVVGKRKKYEVESFDEHDLDQIFTLTFNYGVTLLDLDQTSLAEQFIQKASKLLAYTSSDMLIWEAKVKEVQEHLTALQTHSNAAQLQQAAKEATTVGDEEGVGSRRKRTAEEALLPQSPQLGGRVQHLTLDAMTTMD